MPPAFRRSLGRTIWIRTASVVGAATAIAIAALLPLGASASVGTGVGANPIVLGEQAQPGHSYSLPELYVVNTGTQVSRYGVHVGRLGKGSQHDVPSSWVELPSSSVTLGAGESASLPLGLVVPVSAPPGDYMTDLVVGTVAAGGSPGTSLGAAAATQLRFSVASVDAGFVWPLPLWTDALLTGAALLVALFLLARRAGVRLQVELRR